MEVVIGTARIWIGRRRGFGVSLKIRRVNVKVHEIRERRLFHQTVKVVLTLKGISLARLEQIRERRLLGKRWVLLWVLLTWSWILWAIHFDQIGLIRWGLLRAIMLVRWGGSFQRVHFFIF